MRRIVIYIQHISLYLNWMPWVIFYCLELTNYVCFGGRYNWYKEWFSVVICQKQRSEAQDLTSRAKELQIKAIRSRGGGKGDIQGEKSEAAQGITLISSWWFSARHCKISPENGTQLNKKKIKLHKCNTFKHERLMKSSSSAYKVALWKMNSSMQCAWYVEWAYPIKRYSIFSFLGISYT